MATEKRLIDANSFLNLLDHVVYDFFEVCTTNGMLTNRARVGYYKETIVEALRQTKTEDAVEVVRCKDCKYQNEDGDCDIHDTWFTRKPDSFCCYGERKDNE